MSETVETMDSKDPAKVESAGARAADRLRGVKDDLGKRLDTVSKDVRREAERAGEYARERYTVAKDNLRQGYERARKDAERVAGDVSTYVRENPGKSVLIAAGVGFLVGLLVGRERRDR